MPSDAPFEPRPDTHSVAVLDLLVFDELRDSLVSQPNALAGVYRKFLQGAVVSINAVNTQDVATRISTVHTLKGTAAMLGANRLAALAAQLQTDFEHLEDAAVESAVRHLHDELAAFRHCVNARFASIGQAQP